MKSFTIESVLLICLLVVCAIARATATPSKFHLDKLPIKSSQLIFLISSLVSGGYSFASMKL